MRKICKHIAAVLAAVLLLTPLSVQAVDNNGYGWGYKAKKNNQPPEVGKYGPILEKYDGIYLDPSGDKVIYLTFDNGYEQGYTGKILDVLKKKKVPATFFVTGHYVKSEPELIKRMAEEGHIIGNHSWSHPDFTKLSKGKMKQELEKVRKQVSEITGNSYMKYVRPPRGTFSERTLKAAKELGYIHVFWSLAFVDWNTDHQKGWEYAYKSVISQIHPGAVILLHTVSQDNAEALGPLIDELRKRGYKFKSLDDLMWKRLTPLSVFY
ncbi:MAG: delta-lactam-biosynthetic de-N-acetylase [Bacillaceae bacterium]|nr:delta-lactam-biosynthetic de-N-acetylase [Bacillaceae bacterium]